jgi:outer membrane protein assembly factor BamA
MSLLGGASLFAQDSLRIEVSYDRVLLEERTLSPEGDLKSWIDSLINDLHYDQYLEAALDSIQLHNGVTKVYIHKGQQYKDIYIIPNEFAIEYAQGKLRARSYPYEKAIALKESLLLEADNNGYPFAEIQFQNIQIEADKVSAEMHLVLQRKVLISELKVIGDSKVHPSFLGAYLGLNPGKPLSKAQLLKAQNRLDNLPFVSSTKQPNVLFNDDGAEIFLFAKEKQASRFDALLGVLPANDPLLDRSVILTATAMVDLVNTLQRGERILFEFRQLKPLTQDLSTEVRLPYFAGLPFGLRASFDLAKQDTSFLDIDYTIGAQYLYGGNNFIEIFYAFDISRLLNVDEDNIISSRALPARLDTRIQYYGLQWNFNNLDNILNPRNGWQLKSKLMIGAKEIRPSSLILDIIDPMDEDFDFNTLYDGLERQDQLILTLDAEKYFSLGKQSALKVDLHAASLFSEGVIFDNERFRIGGNQLLRGFNEQQFFTDRYLVNSLEYRFTLTGNSVLFAFSDLAVLQPDKSKEDFIYPWGLGAGINFETASGILSLSAAVGRDIGDSNDFFDLTAPRIHIGYVNLF